MSITKWTRSTYSNTGLDKTDPQADINVLRKEMETIRQGGSGRKTNLLFHGYELLAGNNDKRLYDAGLLNLMDIVSAHPYESGPPEEKQGPFQPIWSTLGCASEPGQQLPREQAGVEYGGELGLRKAGDASVNAPNVDEHYKAEYVVRVNLFDDPERSVLHALSLLFPAPSAITGRYDCRIRTHDVGIFKAAKCKDAEPSRRRVRRNGKYRGRYCGSTLDDEWIRQSQHLGDQRNPV